MLRCDKCNSAEDVTRYTLDMTSAIAESLENKQVIRLLQKDMCEACAGPYSSNAEIAKKLIEEIE